jgi:hypothetical protein
MRTRGAIALLLATSLAGCVAIPYKPGSETKHEQSVSHPELIGLTVAPRRLLDEVAQDVLKADARLQRIDGQSFLDTVSPDRPATLAGVLEPAARPRLESTDVDYLVVLGTPDSATLQRWGGGVPLGFLGQQKYSTTYWAAVIDMRQQRLVEQVASTSVGSATGVWFFYGFFVVADTGAGAKKGVVRHIVQTIAQDRPQGAVRVAFVASRYLASQETIESEQKARQAMSGPMSAWALRDRPKFEDAAPPPSGFALVYVFDQSIAPLLPPNLYTGDALSKTEITQLQSGGYFALYAPAGALTLTLEWPYKRDGSWGSWGDATLALNLEDGGIYYLRGELHAFYRLHLKLVDAADARGVLQTRLLLPPAQEVNAQLVSSSQIFGNVDAQMEAAWLYAHGARYADGQELSQDYVEAYKLFRIVESIEGLPEQITQQSTRGREYVAERMGAEQIAEGERRAREWLEVHGIR